MLGLEVSPVVQYLIAFAIIAALLALFAVVLRRLGGKRFAMPGQDRGRGRQPRLGIVDVYDLDRQRQLVLLRRDNVEHLVMLGGPNDLVVESNIVRVPVGRSAPVTEMPQERIAQGEPGHEQGRAVPDAAMAAVPMPVPVAARNAFNGSAARDAEPLLREPAIQQRPQPAPAPQQRPQPAPHATPQPAPAAAPQPGRAEAPGAAPVQASMQAPAPQRQPAPAPAPSPALQQQPAPPLTPAAAPPVATAPAPESPLADLEKVMRAQPAPTAEPKRGLFGFGRAIETTTAAPPFPTRPRATPVAPDFNAQRTPPKFAPAADDMLSPPAARPEPVAEKPASPEKPPAQQKPARPLDDAILADMAKQLESALARPKPPAQPAAAPAALKPAVPPVEAPARQPATQSSSADIAASNDASVSKDLPSEPKTYRPVATVAAAAATVASVASVFRSASSAAPASSATPAGPSSPVPPRPYGAEPPAQKPSPVSESKVDDAGPEEAETAAADRTSSGAVDGVSAQPVAAEAPIKIGTPQGHEREIAPDVGVPVDVAAAPAPRDEPEQTTRPDSKPQLAAEPEGMTGPEVMASTPAAEAEPSAQELSQVELSQEALPKEEPVEEKLSGEPASEESASEERHTDAAAKDEASGDDAPEEERKEPAPAVIDPFSVDEIEAEFARLLGRSVDKDPKSF